MKITNDEIFIAYLTICDLKEKQKNKIIEVFDVKLSFQLIKIMKELEKYYTAILDCRDEIITKYSEKTEEGLVIPEKNKDTVNKKLVELGKLEQEIKDIKINLSDLRKEEKLPLDFYEGIYCLINEDE